MMLSPVRRACLGAALLLSALAIPSAARAADESDALRQRLKDLHAEGADLWIYNNLDEALEQARRENKPLFVTFRCVPCKDCAAFDAEVAKGSDVVEQFAREHFVSVRQVEMKGVDLSLFEFDYDLNWAAMFINADGVVYARYGTQSAAGPDAYNSIEGLRKTMQRVLELHAAYPENAAALKGKRGAAKPYKTALEMPGLENKEKLRGETARNNCIHCHNIHDAQNLHAQATGTFSRDDLWRYPLPDNIGLVIDARDGVRVQEVLPGSPAEDAGLREGDEVTHMAGQPITSIADMQWVLDDVPNRDATLEIRTRRVGAGAAAPAGGAASDPDARSVRVTLKKGWKESDFSWRGSMWSVSPRLRTWTPEVNDEQRRRLGLAEGQAALEVRWINREQPGGRAAYDSGLREGDIVVAVDGEPVQMSHPQFSRHIKLNYKVGDKLPLTVIRGGRRLTIDVELVE
jgi:hypothetical protein